MKTRFYKNYKLCSGILLFSLLVGGCSQAEYKELLGIPADYTAMAVLLVGYEDTTVDETTDGYTGATARNPFDEIVTYVTP